MKNFIRLFLLLAPVMVVIAYITFKGPTVNASNGEESFDPYDNEIFPRDLKYLLPPPVPFFSDPERSFGKKECSDGKDNDGNGFVDEEDVPIYQTDDAGNTVYDDDGRPIIVGYESFSDELCNPTEHVAYGAVDKNEELEQPVYYSHKLHAGELNIQCEYCHSYARRSMHAGIPQVQVCMNCHGEGVDDQGNVVQKVPVEGRTEKAKRDLQYIQARYKADQEIPWAKVHDLPDFVRFTHKGHVRAGVQCQECHGEVQADMTVGRRVAELTMGWCLNCHESHPSIDENYCDEDETGCYEAQVRRTEIKDCVNCHK